MGGKKVFSPHMMPLSHDLTPKRCLVRESTAKRPHVPHVQEFGEVGDVRMVSFARCSCSTEHDGTGHVARSKNQLSGEVCVSFSIF